MLQLKAQRVFPPRKKYNNQKKNQHGGGFGTILQLFLLTGGRKADAYLQKMKTFHPFIRFLLNLLQVGVFIQSMTFFSLSFLKRDDQAETVCLERLSKEL